MTNEQLNPKVLGQLLLMQSVVINLPDHKSIFSFVCKGLLDIPGIENVTYSSELRKEHEKPLPSVIHYPITLDNSVYGEIFITISDFSQYKPYENYLKNFVFMIGVILEERYQRQLNEKHKLELEQRILERTLELTVEKENLAESQRRFNDLMANVKLLSVMLDSSGNIIFCNNYLLQITGYFADELTGKNWFDLFLPHYILEEEKKKFHGAMNGGDLASNYEGVIKNKQGEALIISWNNTLLFDVSRHAIGTASIGEDITQRKLDEQLLKEKSEEIETQNEEYLQLNEELYKAKEKAEESDRLKTAFLQNMSHEIRTPMNAIMGFSDLLENNFDDKLKLKKFAEIINQRCNDLLEIINDILDISKIESGQIAVNYEKFSITELFDELFTFLTEYQKRIEKNHISLKFLAYDNKTDHYIISDKIKIKQIFINLITNAFKFTDTGKIEISGKIDEHKNFQFYVSDTGIGIPLEKHSFVFERFAQIKDESKINVGGTGLGLPIVKGLLDLLGGHIDLKSEPGKGSIFSITIPSGTMNQASAEAVPMVHSFSDNLKNKTILIVEDDYFNLEYLKEILTDTGANLLQAWNGNEAIAIALSNPVDIVLMDIRLPDMSGYEATIEIKKQKPRLKIIAQTAYASNDEIQKAKNAGCSDFISKPTKKETLLNKISANLFKKTED